MKVRHQLTLLLVLVLASIFLLSFILRSSISNKTRSLLNNNLTDTKTKDVPRIIELNDATVKGYAYDYTVWDQMVDFVTQKTDADWAKNELDGSLGNYKIDYIWVLDSNANKFYYSAINNGTHPEALNIYKTGFPEKLKARKFKPFFIKDNNTYVKVFPAPIQPTSDVKRATKPKGYLLLGSIVDSTYMGLLKNISGDIDFSLTGIPGSDKSYVNNKTGELQFSSPLTGLDDKPVGALYISRKYPIVKSYSGYLDLYILGFLGFITLIGTAFYFTSKKIMLSPLSNISTALKEHNSFNLESYNAKKNEFGDLSRLITKFFMQKRKLEIEVEQRKKTETDLYKALDDKYSEQSERIKAEEFLAQQQATLNINNTLSDMPIAELLKQVIVKGAKTMQCERVGIWMFDKKRNSISADYVYSLSTASFVAGEKIYETEYPVYFEHLKKDTLIIADDAIIHQATSCFADAYLLPNNISSMLDVPVISGNDVIGVVCYEHTGPKRKWSVSELVFARSLSDIIALNLEREERKKAEEQLTKTKVRFEETQELAQIGSWEVNLKTMEIIWSTEMYRIFEIEDIRPEQLMDVYRKKIHPDDTGKFEEAVKKLLEDGKTYSVECRLIGNNGEIKHIRAIGETMKSKTQQKIFGIRGTVQNITKQKLAAMAKSEFLSVMSHEIRTPINGVIGIANLLQEETLTGKLKDYVDTLNFSAQHLSTVVSDILDFSKIESGHMSFERVSFNLEKNCRYVYDLFAQKAAEKNLSFNFSFYPPGTENYSMYGDYVRLNQVLSNLLSNAIKFTEKGSVDFTYTLKEDCDEKATVSFSIKDSGIGITELQQKNIFESFTQADETITRQYGGTGLGLTICKKLIELQNGKIFVKSIPGAGSEFIVELTFDKHVYKENDIARITTAEKNQVKDLTGMKILVAEDNKVNAMVLTRFLTKWNITSKVAKDGAEALDHLKNEDFDIVLMDIQMPNIDGIEATKLIRESIDTTYKDITVVAFTADASVDTHRELLKNGFDHCMTKPFNPETLFSFLQKNYEAA